jgi:hypothetical protein
MLQIVNFFWQICLLRQSPEGLPSSRFSTGAVLLTYLTVALGVVVLTRPDQSLSTMSATIVIGIMLQAAVTFLLLQFKGYRDRFNATWSALLGANTIMLLVLVPFNFIILNSDNDSILMFADSATWVCLGWWLAIAGYIYHKSVEVSILQGSVIAFLIEFIGVIIAFNLFPR